ncbi:hypothetical protein VNO78_35244 [Psophocarpus tetragonolobus]|uniref:Uncharacterized protein n=1 Tax=Psophocarpus tetragonolobus TaxID=3891 RepID=A0AAN9NMA8_PSOTE
MTHSSSRINPRVTGSYPEVNHSSFRFLRGFHLSAKGISIGEYQHRNTITAEQLAKNPGKMKLYRFQLAKNRRNFDAILAMNPAAKREGDAVAVDVAIGAAISISKQGTRSYPANEAT